MYDNLLKSYEKNPKKFSYQKPEGFGLTEYTYIKASDGSQVTIPVYTFADGKFYDSEFAQAIKNNNKIILGLNNNTLPEQGVVGLPVYYIADSSEITINRFTSTRCFYE